jgi:hypothetical protein
VSAAPTFAVVGHPNKGKSSIVSTLAQDDSVRSRPSRHTTECRAYPMRVDGEVQYVLVDTPGFQRARRALEWMRARETTAAAHARSWRRSSPSTAHGRVPGRVRAARARARGRGHPLRRRRRAALRPDYEAEMEILRWTGQPSMALINPIGGTRTSTSGARRSRSTSRSCACSTRTRRASRRARAAARLRSARRPWRAPLEAAVAALQRSARACTRASRARSRSCSPTCCTFDATRRIPIGADPGDFRESLEREWKHALRDARARARRAVEQIYGHRAIEREERAVELLEQDLFSVDHWSCGS